MAVNEYPQDEFDRLAQARSIRGTHRSKESNAKWWAALAAILILAPLAGWGIVTYAGTRANVVTEEAPVSSSTISAAPTDTASSAPEASASASAEPSASTAPEPTAEPTAEAPAEPPAPVADKTRTVHILNGAGVTGLAKKKAAVLSAEGFTSVKADNYSGNSPRTSWIYYEAESDQPAAALIATALGIPASNMTQSASAAGGGIAVVLRSDVA